MKLLDQYKSTSQPMKASLWFLVCGFLQKGIAFLTTPLFTRVMTEEAYGTYTIFNSWMNVITVICSLNLAAGVFTKGLVKNEEDQDRFTSSLLGLSTTCISAFFIVYLLLHKFINPLVSFSTPIMIAMFLDIWATSCYQFWINKERANYKYVKLIIVTLLYVILSPVVGLICVVYLPENLQAEGRIFSIVGVGLILFSILFFAMMKRGKQFYHKEYWKYALVFNLPLLPHYLSQILLNQSDRLMIDAYWGASMAAYYSVAHSLALIMQIFNTAVSGSMTPWMYRSIKSGQVKKIGAASYTVLICIAVMNFCLIAVAPEIMRIIAPASYASAVWCIPPLAISVYFMFLYSLFAVFEFYYEKTKFIMIASVGGAVVNIILNAIFIPRFGYIAAAYTTAVCYILYSLFHYLFMDAICKKELRDQKVYNPLIIVVIGVVLIGASACMMLLYNLVYVRYIVLLVTILLCIAFRKKIINAVKQIRGNSAE